MAQVPGGVVEEGPVVLGRDPDGVVRPAGAAGIGHAAGLVVPAEIRRQLVHRLHRRVKIQGLHLEVCGVDELRGVRLHGLGGGNIPRPGGELHRGGVGLLRGGGGGLVRPVVAVFVFIVAVIGGGVALARVDIGLLLVRRRVRALRAALAPAAAQQRGDQQDGQDERNASLFHGVDLRYVLSSVI